MSTGPHSEGSREESFLASSQLLVALAILGVPGLVATASLHYLPPSIHGLFHCVSSHGAIVNFVNLSRPLVPGLNIVSVCEGVFS